MLSHSILNLFRVENLKNTVKRSILSDSESLHEQLVSHVVETNVLRIATSNDEFTVRADCDCIQMLIARRILSCYPLISQAATRYIILAIYYSKKVAFESLPHVDLSAESCGNYIFIVRMVINRENFRSMSERVH
jgi:hypothetical protein